MRFVSPLPEYPCPLLLHYMFLRSCVLCNQEVVNGNADCVGHFNALRPLLLLLLLLLWLCALHCLLSTLCWQQLVTPLSFVMLWKITFIIILHLIMLIILIMMFRYNVLQFTIGRARSRRATLYRDVGRDEVPG